MDERFRKELLDGEREAVKALRRLVAPGAVAPASVKRKAAQQLMQMARALVHDAEMKKQLAELKALQEAAQARK